MGNIILWILQVLVGLAIVVVSYPHANTTSESKEIIDA